jgi:agmatine deiminase
MISANERPQSMPPDFGALMLKTPAEAGYRMPAEWEPHACCWMCWPSRREQWADGIAGAQGAYAAIARAIRRFEPVRMVAEPQCVEDARAQCGSGVEVLPIPIDDPWMRDGGPTFVRRGEGALAATAWRFNCWGGKYPEYADTARLAGRVATLAGLPCINPVSAWRAGPFIPTVRVRSSRPSRLS